MISELLLVGGRTSSKRCYRASSTTHHLWKSLSSSSSSSPFSTIGGSGNHNNNNNNKSTNNTTDAKLISAPGGGVRNNNNNNNNNNNSGVFGVEKNYQQQNNNYYLKQRDDKENNKSGRQSPRRIVVKRRKAHPPHHHHHHLPEPHPYAPDAHGKIENTTTSPSLSLLDRVGIFQQKKRFPIHEEIRDSSGHLIYVPPTTTSHGGSSSHPHFAVVHVAALLDAKEYCISKSATASTSKSGTDAARRLLRGKKAVMDVLRHHVHYYHNAKKKKNNNNNKTPPNLQHYVIQGHGVPIQVLQNHVDLAHSMLSTLRDAAAISFRIDNANPYNQREWILRIRNRQEQQQQQQQQQEQQQEQQEQSYYLDSENQYGVINDNHNSSSSSSSTTTTNYMTLAWPVRPPDEVTMGLMKHWNHDMQLYLTVMNRLATQLSGILQKPNHRFYKAATTTAKTKISSQSQQQKQQDENMETGQEQKQQQKQQQQQDEDSSSSHVSLLTPPRYWNVEVLRGFHFDSHQLPNGINHTLSASTSSSSLSPSSSATPLHQVLYPVVEWTPLENTNLAPGQVCIRLQGYPTMALSRAAQDPDNAETILANHAVSLCFDACFRDN